jgi:hypothetical protein
MEAVKAIKISSQQGRNVNKNVVMYKVRCYYNSNLSMKKFMAPNILIDCLTLLLHILEVPGSNLSSETSYPD